MQCQAARFIFLVVKMALQNLKATVVDGRERRRNCTIANHRSFSLVSVDTGPPDTVCRCMHLPLVFLFRCIHVHSAQLHLLSNSLSLFFAFFFFRVFAIVCLSYPLSSSCCRIYIHTRACIHGHILSPTMQLLPRFSAPFSLFQLTLDSPIQAVRLFKFNQNKNNANGRQGKKLPILKHDDMFLHRIAFKLMAILHSFHSIS